MPLMNWLLLCFNFTKKIKHWSIKKHQVNNHIFRSTLQTFKLEAQSKKNRILFKNTENSLPNERKSRNSWRLYKLFWVETVVLESGAFGCASKFQQNISFSLKMEKMHRRWLIYYRFMQNGNTVPNKIYRKGLYYDFDEPMVILAELPGHNPFVKFTKFLIQSVQMKSKECY